MKAAAKLLPFLLAVLSVAIASGFTALLNPRVSFVPGAAFTLAVVLASWRGNFLAGLLAGILGALIRQWMYLRHVDSAWQTTDTANVLTFVVVAALISGLMHSLRRQQATLRANAEEFRMLFSSVHNYAIFSLDAAGRITSWNEGCKSVLGYKREEFLGMDFARLFVPEDRAAGIPQRERQQALECGVGADERWMVRKDGQRFWASGLVHVLRNESGEAVGFSKILRDMTDKKRNEMALRDSHVRLSEYASDLEQRVAERTASLQASMKGIEELLYTIAHDLRAPNRAMKGYAELLEHDYGNQLDSTARDYLARISTAASRNDLLIRDLLRFGQLAHANVPQGKVEPRTCLDEALKELAPEIQERQAHIEVRGDFTPVLANDTLLRQVFVNLLSNALRYVPSERTPRIVITSERSYGRVILRVEDNGCGIPAHLSEQAFQPFVRLCGDASSPGTGMGLAIVRKAAERMQGKVGLETRETGSSFWIDLRAAEENESNSLRG